MFLLSGEDVDPYRVCMQSTPLASQGWVVFFHPWVPVPLQKRSSLDGFLRKCLEIGDFELDVAPPATPKIESPIFTYMKIKKFWTCKVGEFPPELSVFRVPFFFWGGKVVGNPSFSSPPFRKTTQAFPR